MTFTRHIPADQLADLDLHEGDTLHVIAVEDSEVVIRVTRADNFQPSGKVSKWLRTARGSVRLAPGETVDDVRMRRALRES